MAKSRGRWATRGGLHGDERGGVAVVPHAMDKVARDDIGAAAVERREPRRVHEPPPPGGHLPARSEVVEGDVG